VGVVSKRALLHCLFAFLLLLAQHGALTHSVWHLAGQVPGAVQAMEDDGAGHRNGGDSRQSKLCDLHFLLGSVLGGDCPAQGAVAAAVADELPATVERARHLALSTPTPPSRAPPVLL
jgi:hypothetical protein